MPRERVVPLFVYRTVPVVVCVRDWGRTPAFGGQRGRLGKRGVGGPMSTAVAAPVRLKEAVAEYNRARRQWHANLSRWEPRR
jgi:hypothetical protein